MKENYIVCEDVPIGRCICVKKWEPLFFHLSDILTQLTANMCPAAVLVDQVAFAIQATDAEGDKLTYSLTGSNAVYFNVDENTGIVTVRRALNREVCFGGDTLQL